MFGAHVTVNVVVASMFAASKGLLATNVRARACREQPDSTRRIAGRVLVVVPAETGALTSAKNPAAAAVTAPLAILVTTLSSFATQLRRME